MPFKSESQRRYMQANHPEIAKQFAAETPKGTVLPKHVKGSVAQKRHVKVMQGLKKAFP